MASEPRKKRAAKKSLRERLLHPVIWVVLLLASLAGAVVWLGSGCGGWDPQEPFMRNAPEVDEAIRLMDAGDYGNAAAVLERYLDTEKCNEGEISVPASARKKPDGTFDLGLTLFYIAEKYGKRFGEEEVVDDGASEPAEPDERRTAHIDCALDVVTAIAGDAAVPAELRARAFYLAGNLEFLRREYDKAVEHYDEALRLVPGIAADADGDPLGRDAAWNRAIALRRLQDNDAGAPDAEPDAEPDGGGEGDQGDGGGEDEQEQSPDGGGSDDAGSGDEEEADAGGSPGEDQEEDAGSGDEEEDERAAGEPKEEQGPIAESGEPESDDARMRSILEELGDAPTYQQEAAKRGQSGKRRRVLEDK